NQQHRQIVLESVLASQKTWRCVPATRVCGPAGPAHVSTQEAPPGRTQRRCDRLSAECELAATAYGSKVCVGHWSVGSTSGRPSTRTSAEADQPRVGGSA